MSEHRPAAPGAAARCPSCGARVVPGQEWCSLCLQPLAEQQQTSPHEDTAEPTATTGPTATTEPTATTGSTEVRGPTEVTGPTGPVADLDPADPYAAASGAVAAPRPLPPGAAEAMLAELAATSAADRPLGRGPLSGTSRPVRTALGCGAGLILLGVLLTLLWLVGLLL